MIQPMRTNMGCVLGRETNLAWQIRKAHTGQCRETGFEGVESVGEELGFDVVNGEELLSVLEREMIQWKWS